MNYKKNRCLNTSIIKKDDLVITASDLDLTIQVTVEVGGKENGSTVLPAKLAGDIVRALPSGQVEISMRGVPRTTSVDNTFIGFKLISPFL